jgi:hypothetical protein
VRGLAVDDAWIYVVADGAILALSKDGNTRVPLAKHLDDAQAIVVRGDDVYVLVGVVHGHSKSAMAYEDPMATEVTKLQHASKAALFAAVGRGAP